jgi:hypothetical protein
MNFRAILTSISAIAALATTSSAALISYTMTGTLSGSLNGTSFTNRAITLTTTTDTANVVDRKANQYVPEWSITGTTTIDISGLQTVTLNNADYGVWATDWSDDFIGLVGFKRISDNKDILRIYQGNNPDYNLTTAGTFSGSSETSSNTTYNTSGGNLVITSTSGNGTFTAVAVPEPSTLSLVALGAIGLASRRRKA